MCSWLFSCQPAHALPGRSEAGGMPPETGGPGFTFVPFGQERRRDGIVLRNPAGAFEGALDLPRLGGLWISQVACRASFR